MVEGLFATLTNVNFDNEALGRLMERVDAEKQRMVPGCAVCAAPCGRTGDYDLSRLWEAGEDIRSLKSLILFGIRGIAAYAYHAAVLGYLYKARVTIGTDGLGVEELLPVVLEVG